MTTRWCDGCRRPVDECACEPKPTPLAEPVFVLRAQDRCAPAAVRDWAHRARGLGAPQAKVDGAMGVALEMEAWQRLYGCKTPD